MTRLVSAPLQIRLELSDQAARRLASPIAHSAFGALPATTMLRATTTRARSQHRSLQQTASATQWRSFASELNREIKDPTSEEEAEVAPFRKKIHFLKKYNPPIKAGKKGINIVRACICFRIDIS